MTLAIKLIQGIVNVHLNVHLARRFNGSAVRVPTNAHTDAQTDRTDSITLTADMGGKNNSPTPYTQNAI